MLNEDAPNYFTTAFRGDFEEAFTREMSIPDRNPLLFEKYIVEHMAGYLLDLVTITDLELGNLAKDACFYMLERLKALVGKQLKFRQERSSIAEKQRGGIPLATKGSIECISQLPEYCVDDHTSHTLCLNNVCMSIDPPGLEQYDPGGFQARAKISLSFGFSAYGIARIRKLIDIDSGYPWQHPSRPDSADTFICLEDRGKQFPGTLYDLWQGLWYIRTGVPPRHPTRRGYRDFLNFCDVDDKTHLPNPRSGTWPFFAEEWFCTKAVVRVVNYWKDKKREKRDRQGSDDLDGDDDEEEEEEEEQEEGKAYIKTIEQLHAVSIATRIERGGYIKPY